MREICISIIIVVIIISLDIIMQNYTKKSTEEIIDQLEEIGKDLSTIENQNKLHANIETIEINEDKQKELERKFKEIQEKWKEKNEKLAYYIEHNELEKVETNITSMISYIRTGEYTLALDKIETNIFVLQHIKDKYQLSLDNIF